MRHTLIYLDEDGFWVAEVPSLPGCNTQGRTREEALSNIKEAIDLYLSVLSDEGETVPPDIAAAELLEV